MPKSFFTGTVVAPGFFTLASTAQAMVTSKSVAVNSKRSSSARSSTLERMGSVVRVLTTFWTACKPGDDLVFGDGQVHARLIVFFLG